MARRKGVVVINADVGGNVRSATPGSAGTRPGGPAARRVALVTGASRGIGAEVARQLGAAGFDVLVNCREKAKRATAVVDSIRATGGQASVARADICDDIAVDAMLADIDRIDALVLNASGGLERGADPGYAMCLNRDAQRRLATSALSLMPSGARIVFVTSHQAHFYPEKPVPDGYEPIAHSKRAGEDALLAMQPRLEELGIELRVVSGDMIDGTIIVRLLQRRDPAAVEARRTHAVLPTIDEFATAIARAAADPDHPHTTYVGGADYLT